jgi:hypothetical protein
MIQHLLGRRRRRRRKRRRSGGGGTETEDAVLRSLGRSQITIAEAIWGGPRQGRSLQIHGQFPRGWLIGLPTIQKNAQLLSKFITDLHERNKV